MKLTRQKLKKIISEILNKDDVLIKEGSMKPQNLKFFIDNPHIGTEKAIHGNVMGEDPIYLIRMLAGSVYSLKQRVKELEDKLSKSK